MPGKLHNPNEGPEDLRILKIEDENVHNGSVGRAVRYVPMHAEGDRTHKDCEDGIITTYNNKFVFVRYGTTLATHGQATHPEDLVWLT
jgi:hypothetical protein